MFRKLYNTKLKPNSHIYFEINFCMNLSKSYLNLVLPGYIGFQRTHRVCDMHSSFGISIVFLVFEIEFRWEY